MASGVAALLSLFVASAHAAPLTERQATSNFAAIPASAWTALGTQVGGRLQPGYPWARPCYTLASPGTQGGVDAAACLAVQNNYTSELGIVENFGGYLTSQWPSTSFVDASHFPTDLRASDSLPEDGPGLFPRLPGAPEPAGVRATSGLLPRLGLAVLRRSSSYGRFPFLTVPRRSTRKLAARPA